MKLVAIFVLVASLLSLAAAGIMPDAAITSTTNTSIAVQHAANTSDTVQHASGGPSNKEPPTGSTEGGFNITVVDDPYFPSGSEIHCSGHPFPVSKFNLPFQTDSEPSSGPTAIPPSTPVYGCKLC